MKNVTEQFGARIRELRKIRGITQEQLAEHLGIEQKHVSLIEHGKSYPSLDRLTKIAEALQVPLPELFDFIHLTNQETRVQSLETMLKGLDEKSQQLAYQIFASIIRLLKN